MNADDPGVPENEEAITEGTQEIKVTIRNLSSRVYITAGYTDFLEAPTLRETPLGDGTWVAGRTLRRGDAYTAIVYTPSTNETERREAGNEIDRPDLMRFRDADPALQRRPLPERRSSSSKCSSRPSASSPRSTAASSGATASPLNEAQILGRSSAARTGGTWELAQQLRDEAETQEDLVQSVMSYLRRGFAYTETPPPEALNLEGFLFDAKSGYCQQFSGAMALLLRMAGVPDPRGHGLHLGLARHQDEGVRGARPRRPLVGRGLVPRPRLGHVRPDPGGRAAPLAAQRGGREPEHGRQRRPPSSAATSRRTPAVAPPAPEEGTPWVRYVLLALAGVAAAAGAFWLWRRRRRRAGTPQASVAIAELERALRRTRHHPGPGTTLHSLEERFARSPAAAGYVRAVRDLRYGGRPGSPTPAQRRGLRAELARGMGFDRAAAGLVGTSASRPLTYTRSLMDDVYDLFKRGTALLEAGDFNSATVPLSKAAELEPEKTSIREALGRAYFRSRQFEEARVEFAAVVELAPTNDYALFCLGRALMELGRTAEARKAAHARGPVTARKTRLRDLPGTRRQGRLVL